MNRLALPVVSSAVLALALSVVARGDLWDKKTIITVNQSIQVPNKVLPPGTYVMKLMDSASDRHIVQIFNARESHIETTVLAIPNYRLQPTDKTQFAWWETAPGQPKAMRAWFYPGDNFGQEFVYPKGALTAMTAVARVQTAPEPAPPPPAAAPEPEQQATVTPEPAPAPAPEQPTEMAQNTPPPAPEAASAPPQTVPEQLPKTGSSLPLIGLGGMFSLAAFGLIRALRAAA